MSSNLVIVAIPDQDDRVWRISSEKVPHLTLLFLGDAGQVSNLDQIMLFVEHAASTSLKRFYLPVDHRGELGEDKADVLFFKKGRYDFAAVRDFRSLLLKDTNIKSAYDSTRQFEAPQITGQSGQPWIPHLTLGYPTSPAKTLPEGEISNFYDVNFNRIAVWTGAFEGPEFLLKDYWDDFDEMAAIPMDVAMSDLKHHGVKGQKWGVRKQELAGGGHIRISNKTNVAGVSNASVAGIVGLTLVVPGIGGLAAFLHPRVRQEWKAANAHNKLVSQDQKWKKQIDKAKKGIEVHNNAADEINSKISGFNSDKRWKDASGKDIDLIKDPVKQKEYDDAVTKEVINPAYANAAVKVYGSKSPSERYTFQVNDAAKGELKVTDALAERRKEQLAGVRHAATDEDRLEGDFVIPMTISRNPVGHILGFQVDIDPELENLQAEHTVELGEEFLAHLSEEPWSNFAKADYTLEQWHAACLIHTHDGDPTSKSECKLPVKTPDGALNRNGVHAAAAALAGARGGLKGVSDDQKQKAAGALRRYYAQLDEDPPESLAQSAVDLGSEFILEHFGVKGMHWGQRKSPPTAVSTSSTSVVPHGTKRKTKIQVEGGENHPAHDDAIRVAEAKAKLKKSGTSALSNQELREMANRLQLENQVAMLTSSKGKKFVSREFEATSQQLIKKGTKKGVKRYGPTVAKKAGKAAATAATIAVL